jgi:hypothetical protein
MAAADMHTCSAVPDFVSLRERDVGTGAKGLEEVSQ